MTARTYRYRYVLRGETNWREESYPTYLNAVINVWIKKHIERLEIVNERFILDEVEL